MGTIANDTNSIISLNRYGGQPDTPYKGLMPYTEEDASFFFGREKWRDMIVNNLLASRLTVLYGASGVGKSSVLRAGVAYRLRQLAKEHLNTNERPRWGTVVFNTWRDDPLLGLLQQIRTEIRKRNGLTLEPVATTTRFEQTLQHWTEQLGGQYGDGHLFIILDQFEEYFLYHLHENGEGTFAAEFPQALNRPALKVNFLIALREDSLAKLDQFQGRIPHLLSNLLRLEHLDEASAFQAIRQPLTEYNRLQAPGQASFGIEPALVKAVLKQVAIGQVFLNGGGKGRPHLNSEAPENIQIETPYLQIVMTRLWQEEMKARSHRLRLETLTQLGGAQQVIKEHLEARMHQLSVTAQNTAARIFYYLVTPSGTKIAHTVDDLLTYVNDDQSNPEAKLSYEQVQFLLEELSKGNARILRPIGPSLKHLDSKERYEIFHDVLAPAVLDWCRQRIERQLLARELDLQAVDALQQFDSSQLDALLKAMQVGQKVKSYHLEHQTFTPQLALQRILGSIRERMRLQAHKDEIMSVCFSPDGQRFATSSYDKTARLWSLKGNLLTVFKGHKNEVYSVIFSPNGQYLATASLDNTARLWNLDGQLLTNFIGHNHWVRSIDFSPDGQWFVTGSLDGTARLWDLQGNLVMVFNHDQEGVYSIAFCPQGQYIATGSAIGTVRLWDLEGNLRGSFNGYHGIINHLNFSPDGKRLVTASQDSVARQWDLAGNLITEYKGHKREIRYASFSPGGDYIATASSDGTAMLWNLEGHLLDQFTGHMDWVNSLSFSSDRQRLATASSDNTVRLWDINSKQVHTDLNGHNGWVYGVSFSPDGEHLITASDDNMTRIWGREHNWERKLNILALEANELGFFCINFSPNGQYFATGSIIQNGSTEEGIARLWDLKGNVLQEFRGHQASVTSVNFSFDGQYLVTGSTDNTARLWDLEGRLLTIFTGHEGWVQSVSLSIDGQRLATVSSDNTARLWNLTGDLLALCRGHRSGVNSVSFSPDGCQLATGSLDGTARLWDLTGQLLTEFIGHKGGVYSICFSPDGQLLATGSFDNTARLWDLNGHPVSEFMGHTQLIRSVSFSPDGKLLATGSDDGTAKLWPIEDLEQLLCRGCDWLLQDYQFAYPEELASLTICCASSACEKR